MNTRQHLLASALTFLETVIDLPGVHRIALLGSLTTDKRNPKDIDLLVAVSDAADLAPLARRARQLQGRCQQINCGADVFLSDLNSNYLGRTCHWKDCRPGVRISCDALHCGARPYLHDDLTAITLDSGVIRQPPVELWPTIRRNCPLPDDTSGMIDQWNSILARHPRPVNDRAERG
jgi:predicted nucleotidyltransferase